MTAEVTDPDGMIASLSVVHETPELLVIYGDMNGRGKRADVYWLDDHTMQIRSDPDRGSYVATVKLYGLPTDPLIVADGVSRYTLFVVVISRAALSRGAELYAEAVAATGGDGAAAGEGPVEGGGR